MTNYKILIDKTGTPKLVEVPERNEFQSDVYGGFTQEAYEQALSTALSDESKHIAFKDADNVNFKMLLAMSLGGFLEIGKFYDLPDNIWVGFETECDAENNHCECICRRDKLEPQCKRVAILKTLPPNSEDKGVTTYEYGSVICDAIDDLLIQGGGRPLDRSVGVMMKIESGLSKAGFKVIRLTKD